jgi:hypothetical protein
VRGGVISGTVLADQAIFDFALVSGLVMASNFAQRGSAFLGSSEWEALSPNQSI